MGNAIASDNNKGFTSLILMRNPFITECSASPAADNSFVENPVSFNKENILILRILLTKRDVDFTRALARAQSTFSAKTRFLQSSPGTK